MDAERFEALLRTVTSTPSRRGAVRLLMGLALAGPLAGLEITATAAKRKHRKRKKKHQNPPPATCPPVCPICQGCEPTTGLCAADPRQQGLPAPGCEAPSICCSGSCCDSIHSCNAAGTCATCAQVCPDTCATCVNLADGGTACSNLALIDCAATCTTTADCPAGRVCATSNTTRDTNETTQVCGQPVGSGLCYPINACA